MFKEVILDWFGLVWGGKEFFKFGVYYFCLYLYLSFRVCLDIDYIL